ncbi:GrpB-like predicted nucleotidyltransferase (UPF0157 family) [Ensifer adhaerens]|uniref:GrpB-like predicted nucleotidyltransferase (UPF0157 family) n=1 Tax=Ensifer adhaerens TaxID=106592 RepID=A0ACC5SNM5_ENSAD|nr:GrpB family protein [Ensifer adhaerens]MBP1870475.1 GrpB-like predicted nucleotidyltransferase (UPF0157 family) [Ensifer adhaerens]
MLPPIKVELLPHDPRWVESAALEGDLFAAIIGSCLVAMHHVGSTAIPTIRAKPVLDLVPVVTDLQALDDGRRVIEAHGYEWWGELGLPGRRYCTKSDPATGRRLVQLHCYEDGSSEIERHLTFRDYLRSHPQIAAAYDREKARCRDLHPEDSHAYSDCKDAWIKAVEAQALAWRRA